MRYLHLMLLLLLLVSCAVEIDGDYVVDCEDARLVTIDAWESIIGPVSAKCRQASEEMRVVEVNTMPDDCRPSKPGNTVTACYYPMPDGGRCILILAKRSEKNKARSCVHEWAHLLERCELKPPDREHANPRIWEEFGPNTVEARGERNLNF